MPNHCWNEVSVNKVGTTDKTAWDVIHESMIPDPEITGEMRFSFTKVVPQPPDLFMEPVGNDAPAHNWYNWNLANWGTKWDAYEATDEMLPENSVNHCFIAFNTAWCPPMEFFKAWSLKYPEFSFDILCDIEGEGPEMPRFVFNNGECVDMTPEIRTCSECDLPEDEHTDENGDYCDCDEVWHPNKPDDADKPAVHCPHDNDTSNDCKNCVFGKQSHWDGSNCVER